MTPIKTQWKLVDPKDFIGIEVKCFIDSNTDPFDVKLNEIDNEKFFIETNAKPFSPSQYIHLEISNKPDENTIKIRIKAKILKVKLLTGENIYKVELTTEKTEKENLNRLNEWFESKQKEITLFLKAARGQ